MLRIVESTNRRAVRKLLAPGRDRDQAAARRAGDIVDDVRRHGDRALLRYARQLDGLTGSIEVSRDEMRAGAAAVPKDVRVAIRTAARHIRIVARRQVPARWRVRVARGVSVEQRIVPLDRVGCYVPGGRYPLPSSLLMTAVPAVTAGVKDVIAVCPRPEPAVMAAALEARVTRLFRVGGAHAVAALAYGTATVPRVDKIVGPGNRYVAEAKTIVAADCGIDFYAGPTEIVIVATRGPATWIAADLIAQAEHDPEARAVLVTPSRTLADQVARAVASQLQAGGPAAAALAAHGGVIVAKTRREAIAIANEAAPEHLVVEDERMAKEIRCTGSLFVGPWSVQAAGDYVFGSNHVLPTAGAARVRGGLSGADFVRQFTVQRVTRSGLEAVGPAGACLARAEGLTAHAASVTARLVGRTALIRPRKSR